MNKSKWIKIIQFNNRIFYLLLAIYILCFFLDRAGYTIIPKPVWGWVAIGLATLYILNGFQTLFIWLFLGGKKAKEHLEERNKAL